MAITSTDSQESLNAGTSFQLIKTSVYEIVVPGRTPHTSNSSTISSKSAVRVGGMEGQAG